MDIHTSTCPSIQTTWVNKHSGMEHTRPKSPILAGTKQWFISGSSRSGPLVNWVSSIYSSNHTQDRN